MINPEPSAPVDDETAGSGEKRGFVCERKSKRGRKTNGCLNPSVPRRALFHVHLDSFVRTCDVSLSESSVLARVFTVMYV